MLNEEGFWKKKPFENLLTSPINHEWKERTDFLSKLGIVERQAVFIRLRGFERCLICGIHLGKSRFQTDTWVWPINLKHYIDLHNVKPSDNFIHYVEDVEEIIQHLRMDKLKKATPEVEVYLNTQPGDICTAEGGIRLDSQPDTLKYCVCGVVMVSRPQATVAQIYGWKIISQENSSYLIRKDQ